MVLHTLIAYGLFTDVVVHLFSSPYLSLITSFHREISSVESLQFHLLSCRLWFWALRLHIPRPLSFLLLIKTSHFTRCIFFFSEFPSQRKFLLMALILSATLTGIGNKDIMYVGIAHDFRWIECLQDRSLTEKTTYPPIWKGFSIRREANLKITPIVISWCFANIMANWRFSTFHGNICLCFLNLLLYLAVPLLCWMKVFRVCSNKSWMRSK